MSEQKFRVESDLIGELQVPADAYYGVQTQRALNNYKISNTRMCDYPEYIIAMAYVKMAAASANAELGVLDKKIGDAIVAACKEPGNSFVQRPVPAAYDEKIGVSAVKAGELLRVAPFLRHIGGNKVIRTVKQGDDIGKDPAALKGAGFRIHNKIQGFHPRPPCTDSPAYCNIEGRNDKAALYTLK